MVHLDWFIFVVEKVILSIIHLKETQLIMPNIEDKRHFPSEFYSPGDTNEPKYTAERFSSGRVFCFFIKSHNKLRFNKAN